MGATMSHLSIQNQVQIDLTHNAQERERMRQKCVKGEAHLKDRDILASSFLLTMKKMIQMIIRLSRAQDPTRSTRETRMSTLKDVRKTIGIQRNMTSLLRKDDSEAGRSRTPIRENKRGINLKPTIGTMIHPTIISTRHSVAEARMQEDR